MSRRKRSSEQGSELVEFALASMVFFLLTFGIIEFSMILWQYNMVSDLAQEGARYAAVHGSGVREMSCDEIGQWLRDNRAYGTMLAGALDDANAITCPDGEPSSKSFGDAVSVQVTATYIPITRFIPGSGSYQLTNKATMVVATSR